MSLGDYLRLLRAKGGGLTPWDIEAATTLPKGLYRQMEQRYRAIGDDASIAILADYYAIPFEDLRWRLDWSRKALSRALHAAATNQTLITLNLWNRQEATGKVVWWDLGAVGLDAGSGLLLVVQRHAVERWDPRAAEDSAADADDPNDEDDD